MCEKYFDTKLKELVNGCIISGMPAQDIANKLTAMAESLEADIPDSDVNAKWIISCDGYYPFCSNCWSEPSYEFLTMYWNVNNTESLPHKCPSCGAKMEDGLH